jgi:hypothetical protein
MPITISGSTGIAGVDGSAGTPAIQGTDTNTGISFPAADTIAFNEGGAEVMRINSSGNVGIGTSSPTSTLQVVGATGITTTDGTSTARLLNSGGVGITGTSTNHPFIIQSNNAERVRVTAAGLVGIGTASPGYAFDVQGQGQFVASPAGGFGTANIIATAGTGNALIALHTAGSAAPMLRNERGLGEQIDCVNSTQTSFGNFRAAAFSVVSDYRIKENLSPLSNSTERVKQLKPTRFSFTEGSMSWNEGRMVDGFLAHEVAEVVPEAVTGLKDALKEDGTPLYQSLDQAKLVPLLTAALQDALAQISDLKARVTALEAK